MGRIITRGELILFNPYHPKVIQSLRRNLCLHSIARIYPKVRGTNYAFRNAELSARDLLGDLNAIQK